MIPVSQPSLGMTERRLVNECLSNNQLTYGPMVRRFEQELAQYLKVPHVLATSSGTTALHLTLAALGIGPGDEVLVPDLTFVATANAVRYTGARCVLVDVDSTSWCFDVRDVGRKLTMRTRVLMPVHLYGVPADMAAILAIANDRKIFVVEDAAEGFGGRYFGYPLGTLGIAGTFSFYGNKIITTGEGGAVCTQSAQLAERLYSLRGQAMDPNRRFFHTDVGFNYRMTDLQAALGIGQLERIDQIIATRREIFAEYHRRLCYIGCASCVRPNAAPWLFTLLLHQPERRDDLMARLAERGIETRPAFVPLHRMPMYRGNDADFPASCKIGDGGISLPTFTDMTLEQVNHVCDEVIECATT